MVCLQTSAQCTSATEESRNLEKWIQRISYTEGLTHFFGFYGSKTERLFHSVGMLEH